MVFAGIALSAMERVPWLGRLPGDILIRRENFTFYFPFTSCLLVSAVLSVFFYLFRR